MNVCFFSLSAYPLFNTNANGTIGGAEVQLYYLSTFIAKDTDYATEMVVGDFGQPEIERFGSVVVYKYIETASILDKIKYIRFITRLVRLIQLFKKINADVYIQRCKNEYTAYTAFFCKLFNKKFLFMAASDADVEISTEKTAPFYVRLFHQYGLKNSHGIIVQNRYQQELLNKNYNLDASILKSAYPIHKTENNKSDSILWVGRAVELKQPEIVFSLAQDNPDKQFIMICSEVPYAMDYFDRVKNSAGKMNNIRFIDRVPFHEIDKYFGNAKIFINTSQYEGFPNTFIQAWKNGTPVISLNVNPDDSITDFSLGFHSKSISQMNEDINKLFLDGKLYQGMSAAAYNYVRENHNLEIIIKELKGYLEQITSSPKQV